ncbi:ACT domain-containing protein [Maricaulis sp.]|uniref:ACT domain-containing protein n=1 Tax=Maricaulis sp. TaxID=1486257 RepID=UPI002638C7FD|nr:ACT domain-containing protein [Maricaulis sp.]
MTGGSDLDHLIRNMAPHLGATTYVFVTLPPGNSEPEGLTPLLRFAEDEGLTLILPESQARKAGLDFTFPCRRITLSIQSSLEAVGFMARIATALAGSGIGCNPVSGYFHDHLFVPTDRAEQAMAVLQALSRGEALAEID